MALGAITPQKVSPDGGSTQYFGSLRCTVTTVVCDSSYPTGGSVLAASKLGLTTVLFAIASLAVQGAGGLSEVYYNPVTGKLQAFTSVGEVANATVLSANTAQIVAFGY